MNWINKLLSENSTVSTMRVMSLISVITAICIAFYGMSKATIDYSGLALLCGTFLGAAFGGKVLQKKSETQNS